MRLPNQSSTQVISPFGTYVVEQHDKGFDIGRRFDVPEPDAEPSSSARRDPDLAKAA